MRRKLQSGFTVNYLSFVDIFVGAIGAVVFITLLLSLIAPQIESGLGESTSPELIETEDQTIYVIYFSSGSVSVHYQNELFFDIDTREGYFSELLSFLSQLSGRNDALIEGEGSANRVVFVIYPGGALSYNLFQLNYLNFLTDELNLVWGEVLLEEGALYTIETQEN